MTLPLILRDQAQAEFDEAFDFYDARQAGLGSAFVGEVQRVLDRIASGPQIYPTVFADVRKAVVRRFPYCVFYRALADRVDVIAVFHSGRKPSVWQRRI